MDIMSYLLGQNSAIKKGMKVVVVDELPTTGEANVLYLVPKEDTGENDIFEEWLYVEDEWEKIGTTDIDLSNYYTKDETIAKVTSMPTASIDYLGKVMMYIGQTGTYTNGHFYICVSDGEQTPTYSWVELEVQTIPEYTIPLEVFNLTTSSSSNDIITALGGNDNIIKLREAFKNNKEINAIKKQASGSTVFTTTTPVKYDYSNMYDINEIIKLEAVYTDTSSTTDYKRHFVALTGSSGTWSVTNASVTDIATTELTGLLSNLTTTSKTNLVSAINELAGNSSPITTISVSQSSIGINKFDDIAKNNIRDVGLYLIKNTYNNRNDYPAIIITTNTTTVSSSNDTLELTLLFEKNNYFYIARRYQYKSNGNPVTNSYFTSGYKSIALLNTIIGTTSTNALPSWNDITTVYGSNTIANLQTTDKTSLVDAINEVNSQIGNINTVLATLTTPSNGGV